MSNSVPPQYDPYPFVDPRFEELPPPKGFAAQSAGVLAFCVGLLPLGAALLNVVGLLVVTGNDLEPLDPWIWSTITVCLVLAFAGIYGGVKLLQRKKAGRWWVIAFSVMCVAQVIWSCVSAWNLIPAVVAVAPLLIFALAVSGSTARWVEWKPRDHDPESA